MNKGWGIGIIALVVAGLYWLQAVLIPLALAVLLTFLLSPVVSTLERRGLGRVPSVLVTVLLALSLLGAIGWTLTHQLVTLADELPRYSLNIHHRIADLRGASKGGSVEKVQNAVADVVGEIQKTDHARWDASKAGRRRPGGPVHPRPPAKPPPSVGERGGRDGARDLHAARAPRAPGSADLADWLSADDGDDESPGRSRDADQPVPAHAVHHQRQFRRGRGTRLVPDRGSLTPSFGGPWRPPFASSRTWGRSSRLLLPLALSLAVFPGWLQPALVVGLFLVLEPITGIGAGAVVVRSECRGLAGRAPDRVDLLDLAVGTGGAADGDAPDGLPRRARQALAGPGVHRRAHG